MPTQQISGTIYQMYDASGNYRRFPVTVVDGVLGLASYLQEQFSSLANLYMGINDVALSGTVLTVKGVSVNLATVTDLSNYYTKTEADGRFLGITANAASATKLQTARTIWGQSFDGTANVTGAMSGVTSIDSVINIDNGYVGIGKTPSVALDVNGQVQGTQLISTVTSSAPLVVSSTTQVDNLTSQYATNPKSELKTGQEFVFRKTNVTWDAKSGVIKKIKGKTLAWNQLVRNGNFEDTSNWDVAGGSLSASNNILTWSSAADAIYQSQNFNAHKYYAAASVKADYAFEFGIAAGAYVHGFDASPNTFKRVSFIADIATAVSNNIFFYPGSNTTMQFACVELVDLTILYGSALDGKTDAEILAMYEADFGTGYHPYNPDTLISNDAEAVETTGVNLWDEEWLVGAYVNGAYDDYYTQLICTKNLIPILAGETYYVSANGFYVHYYDADKNYLNDDYRAAAGTITIPDGVAFVKFTFYNTPNYSVPICINLSNPAINGQYFPYKKSRINLGLKNIKVVSPNVWDEQWESGYWDYMGKHDSNAYIRSKNYIPVVPNANYHFTGPVQDFEIDFWDSNKEFISPRVYQVADFTAPSNAKYMTFYTAQTTYNHDICINKSDPAFNGRYFPYGTLELEGGVKGAGSVYDEIRDGKYYKRVGEVDLGSLTWTYDNNYGFLYADLSGSIPIKLYSDHATKRDSEIAINSKYAMSGWILLHDDGSIMLEGSDKTAWIQQTGATATRWLQIKDSAYSDGATFKSAMSGAFLDYELANEEVYDLAEPLPSVYPCDQFGTERVISPVSVTPSAPFCADIQYGAKSDDVANDLIGTRDAVQPLLDALEYDGTNEAWRLKGNFYADGFVSAYGTNESEALQALKDWVTENFEPKQS